jgi:hypothetical protein
VGKPEERDYWEDLDIGGGIIMKVSSRDRMGWYGLDSSGSG